ncbi:MAG: tetratricopeptide repeat protein, partial [Bryobacteraceae bacterium]
KLNPSDLNPLYLLLQIYRALGDRTSLQAVAADVLRLAPGDSTASAALANNGSGSPEEFLNLSMQQYQAGRFADAAESARKALQLRPGYPEAYNNLAAAHASLKQWDDAVQAAREAIRLKPDFQLARNNLAWAEQERAATRAHRRP